MSSSNLSSEWADLPLDPRILEALADLRWAQPTTVQSACIPLALKGRDLSIQSRTGSGKSGAFFIPLIQRIITEREKGKQVKRSSSNNSNPVGLIIVPSVELCAQMVEVGQEIAKYVKPRLMIEDLSTGGAITNSRIHAAHVVVSTAAALAKACRSGAVHAETFAALRYLVVDEADMVVSMAELSLRTVQSVLPSTMQAILCSATLTEGVAMIKGQLLHNPTNIVLTSEDVKDDDDDKAEDATDASKSGPIAESHVRVKEHVDDNLHQHYLVATDECHRHTLLYALYRLSLMEGKTLIFVDQDETTYSLQHFLEQMGIATLVYDANLPMNIRMDTLRRFQHGSTATLVCTDGTLESAEQLQMSMDGTEGEEENEHAGQGGRKRRRGGGSTSSSSSAAPSALHRGVDFSHVRNVILFDGLHASSQLSLSRYTHRIGRAGRAGEEGLSIVFFTVPQAKKNIHLLRSYCESRRTHLTPFKQMQRAEASRLQYRVDTALGNVTRASTRKLRVATVAAELSRSSYLANHMSQKDTDALHRIIKRSAKKVKVEQNLLEVPTYMRLNAADNVRSYTQRVRSDQTRDQAFKKAVRKAPVDPLKAVASKLRNARGKKPSK